MTNKNRRCANTTDVLSNCKGINESTSCSVTLSVTHLLLPDHLTFRIHPHHHPIRYNEAKGWGHDIPLLLTLFCPGASLAPLLPSQIHFMLPYTEVPPEVPKTLIST